MSYKTSAEYQSAYLGCTEALDALITERDEALKEAEFYEIECSAARQEVDDAQADAKEVRATLQEVKRLASDPFASDTVALRACLLAANEALGLPGPQPSPERDIAKAILHEMQSGGEAS